MLEISGAGLLTSEKVVEWYRMIVVHVVILIQNKRPFNVLISGMLLVLGKIYALYQPGLFLEPERIEVSWLVEASRQIG